MFKGLLILAAVGMIFAYLVFNFVGEVERGDPDSYISKSELRTKEWAKYYSRDALGDPVLVLDNAPLETAEAVWRESRLRDEMLENFPNFELIKAFVLERLKPAPFRKYLLDGIDRIEKDYLGGSIDSEQAKKRLQDL